MKKAKMVSAILSIVGIMMISIALIVQSENSFSNVNNINFKEIDMSSVATSTNMLMSKSQEEVQDVNNDLPLMEVNMEIVPTSVFVPPRVEVYDGLTIEELTAKFDRLLGNGYMQGKGYLIASYSLDSGVDPYVALAIILHETGCGGTNSCSNLVRSCNNVGGQKGSPGCNGGAYKSFPTLDEGIVGFINNLSKNYYSVGLTSIDSIAPKYAEGSTWASKIHWYVEKIRNS